MSVGMLIGNGTVVTTWPGLGSPVVISKGAVLIEGERVLAVGKESEFHPEVWDRYLDAGGGIVAPGFVNIHHHFYSALARGLNPGCSMRNFPEILDRLWWRLDRALDKECVAISARLSALECVRQGCTTVFDHHASPSCISGSLDVIAHEIAEAGISALLCYEITDRNGQPGALDGLEENLSFMASHQSDPRIRGVIGLHASFTLSNETLRAVAKQIPSDGGCHLHVAEDPVDVECTTDNWGVGPVRRIKDFGLLDGRALLAHGIHLTRQDYELIADAGATIIHNPESNSNNGVGRLDVEAVSALGCRVGLGTDGMSSAMHRALRTAFLVQRGESRDPTSGFVSVPRLLGQNASVARQFFNEPLLGELRRDAPADVIVLDVSSPTDLNEETLLGHLLYGVTEAPVRHTLARGEVLLEDFRHTKTDPVETAARARELAPDLWERFRKLKWGTPYLG